MPENNQPSPQPDHKPQNPLTKRNPSVDWGERVGFPKRLLSALERLSLALEKPISRLTGQQKFNPLYHTGTITVFLLFIILGTGVYLTMFYQFGFEVSYDAVARIEANFIGRVVRALHRYASGAAVIFALLHGWRTFFQDRFRGPRWLAWLTGILMAASVWLIGISGYWLIWDQRADVLNQTLINLLNNTKLGTAFLVNYLVSEAAGSGWVFMVLVITVHLGLSGLVGLFFWLHIKRLSRAKWLPPRYWMAALALLLVVASVLIPVGMLASINPARLPEAINIDLFYLFYLPAGLNWLPLALWGGAILLVGIASALPWLLAGKKRPPVVVDSERCTGCTLCAADCPYNAIEMIPRNDGKRHKYLAQIDPNMCVACGICIGTCAPLAMSLSEKPAEGLWEETLARISEQRADPVKVVFTCERHAYQGAKSLLRGEAAPREAGGPLVQVVPLTCVGMAHPNLAAQALEAGAAEVQFIGCPPEDCANREGNLWLQERIERERKPLLKQKFKEAPISLDWVPPNDFSRALQNPNQQREATTYKVDFNQINWRHFIPAILLLLVVLAGQIWLSNVVYHPFPAETALLEIVLQHKAGYPLRELETTLEPEVGLDSPTRLILEVDGQTEWEQSYPPQGKDGLAVVFEQTPIAPGEHQVHLVMFDRPNQSEGQILFDEPVLFENHGILLLSYSDAPLKSDPVAGEQLFFESSLEASASCHVCHSVEPGKVIVGPSLAGVATRAAERVPGMSAEDYLRQSILDPDAYVVEGFPAGQMTPDLGDLLSEDQINNLVAYLLTLK